MSKLSDIFEEYNKHTTTAKVNMADFNDAVSSLLKGNPEAMHKFLKDSELDFDALSKTAERFG